MLKLTIVLKQKIIHNMVYNIQPLQYVWILKMNLSCIGTGERFFLVSRNLTLLFRYL